MTFQQALIITSVAITIFSLAEILVFYVFKGVGLFSISKRRKLGGNALAWIPVLSMFKLGQIADDAVLKKRGNRTHYVVLYPVFNIAGGVISCVGAFLCLLSLNLSQGVIDSFLRGNMNPLISHARGALMDPVFYIGFGIFALSTILLIIAQVFLFISLYHIYKSCSGGYVALFVLSLIFSFLYPIFLLAIRKNDNQVWYPTGNAGNETQYYGTENTFQREDN